MATITELGETWNTTAGNKAVTATPAVGDHVHVWAGMSGWASGDDITFADNNADGLGAYDKFGSATAPISTGGGTGGAWWLFVRRAFIGSATSTVFTATITGDSGGGLTVLKTTGMLRIGHESVRQIKGENGAESPVVLTFAAPVLTGNPVSLAVITEDNPAALTIPTGFTETTDTGWATPTTGIWVGYDSSGNTTGVFTWGGGAATDHNEAGVELDASGPGIPNPLSIVRNRIQLQQTTYARSLIRPGR